MSLFKRITLLMTLLLSFTSFAQDFSEDAVAQRIQPVGDVYLKGEIVTASLETEQQPSEPRSGEKIYNSYCIACHATGVAGAPIKDDAKAWLPRVAQGQETLLEHAVNGFNAMPARGTCANCSDDEMAATVEFLIKGLY